MQKRDADQRLRGFALRLGEVCDEFGFPAMDAGRDQCLAEVAEVSRRAARFWLNGENYPAPAALDRLADAAQVNGEWLRYGRGPKRRVETVAAPLDLEAERLCGAVSGVLNAFGLSPDALGTQKDLKARLVRAIKARDGGKSVRRRVQ